MISRVCVCVCGPFQHRSSRKSPVREQRRHPGPTTENSVLRPSAMLVMITMLVNLRKCIEVFGFNNDDDNETTTATSRVTSTRYNVNGISYTFLQQMQTKANHNIQRGLPSLEKCLCLLNRDVSAIQHRLVTPI